MVEKMKLLHITGPKHDIDRAMKQYLKKYEIHYENAMLNLNSLGSVRQFEEINAYQDSYEKSKELLKYLDLSKDEKKWGLSATPELVEISVSTAKEVIQKSCLQIEKIMKRQQEIVDDNTRLKRLMVKIEPFRMMDFEFQKMVDFRFVKFRMGRIPINDYHKLENFIYSTAYTLFYEYNNDENYVWGIYFVPYVHAVEIDTIYLSFHFEQMHMSESFSGTPKEAYAGAKDLLKQHEEEAKLLNEKKYDILFKNRIEILKAYYVLEEYCENFEIRKLAVCTIPKIDKGEYYILYGWMSKREAIALKKDIENDEKILCIEEDVDENLSKRPPRKLKLPRVSQLINRNKFKKNR